MADSLHYQRLVDHGRKEDGSSSKRSRRSGLASKRTNALRRTLTVVILLLAALLAGELLFHLAIAPRIELRSVQLISDMDIGLEQVEELGAISIGELFYLIDEQAIAHRLAALPDVKSASVRRVFPDRLEVNLIGRKPLAMLAMQKDETIVPVVIDGEGVIIRRAERESDWSLPLLRGINFNESSLGAQADQSYTIMLEDIMRLRDEAPDLLRAFSEFRIEEVYPGVYEWVLVPIHMPITVRCSVGLTKERGLYILRVLELMRSQGRDGVSQIDFRTGDVVYSSLGGTDGL